MAQPGPKSRPMLFALVLIAVVVSGVCMPRRHVSAEVSPAEYDVYRAFLQTVAPGRRYVVADHTDAGRIELCLRLGKSDKDLLWELVGLQGRSFPLDTRRLGAIAPPEGPYLAITLSRVAVAGGRAAVLQVSTAECDRTCEPARHEVLTASKEHDAWTFRPTGCAFTR